MDNWDIWLHGKSSRIRSLTGIIEFSCNYKIHFEMQIEWHQIRVCSIPAVVLRSIALSVHCASNLWKNCLKIKSHSSIRSICVVLCWAFHSMSFSYVHLHACRRMSSSRTFVCVPFAPKSYYVWSAQWGSGPVPVASKNFLWPYYCSMKESLNFVCCCCYWRCLCRYACRRGPQPLMSWY